MRVVQCIERVRREEKKKKRREVVAAAIVQLYIRVAIDMARARDEKGKSLSRSSGSSSRRSNAMEISVRTTGLQLKLCST